MKCQAVKREGVVDVLHGAQKCSAVPYVLQEVETILFLVQNRQEWFNVTELCNYTNLSFAPSGSDFTLVQQERRKEETVLRSNQRRAQSGRTMPVPQTESMTKVGHFSVSTS